MIVKKKVVVEGETEVEIKIEDVLQILKQADPLAKASIINGALLALTEEDLKALRDFWKDLKTNDDELLKIDCQLLRMLSRLRECARAKK